MPADPASGGPGAGCAGGLASLCKRRPPRPPASEPGSEPAGEIRLLNTHLDAIGEDHYRIREVRRVRALADSLRQGAEVVLVGGDFNATPESRVIAAMTEGGSTDAWAQCGAGEGTPYPAEGPVKRIDYLFGSPGVRCDSAVVLPSQASDHRPVLPILNRSARP